MSALAIASVTRLLKDLLNDTIVNGDISGDLGVDVTVTALPPDRVIDNQGENQPTQLNVFLHRVTPNPGLTNSDLPTRDARGRLVTKPRLALDLHYLLTAYGHEELQAEILLGYAMEMFHEQAVIPRERVRAALQGSLNGSILPPVFRNSDPARLADQLELVRITPQPLTLDDMSKIWTAMQTNYRTTVAYVVSVVLIERDVATRAALPVLTRGPRNPETGRDAGVFVQPHLRPATPRIDEIRIPARRPAMRLGDTIELLGHELDWGDATVTFTEPETGVSLSLTPTAPPTANRIAVQLPAGAPLAAGNPAAGTGPDPGAWRIGLYQVEARITDPHHPERLTNRLPAMLAPRATPIATAVATGTRIAVACSPPIRAGQSVAIIAGEVESVLPIPTAPTSSVNAIFPGLPAAVTLPVRLRVGGIDSILIDPSTTPPQFDPTQTVVVP
jgi:hypothetical protein